MPHVPGSPLHRGVTVERSSDVDIFRVLWRHRALVVVLVRRELAARYRASLLGYFWSLLNPLMLLAVYAIVFTTVFKPRMAGAQPYALFLFAGLLPWLFFSGALLDAAVTLVDNGPLLAKVVCPAEIFPAVTVLSHLVHHVLALPVLLVALAGCAAVGWHPFPWTIVLLPLALIPWLLTAGGLALAISALAVHFRDIRDLVANLLNLLFFGTPIIYTLNGIHVRWLWELLRLNPMTSLIRVYRSLAFTGHIAGPLEWIIAITTGIVVWLAGAWLFGRLRDTLVEAV